MASASSLRAWIADVRAGGVYPTVDEVVACIDSSSWWAPDMLSRLPPVFRVVVALMDFRAQYLRNGLDGFVWNRASQVPCLIEAFDHIGARQTASLMADLLARQEGPSSPDPVQAFMDIREQTGPAFGPWLDFDPLEEVETAFLDYLDRHAEEVIELRKRWVDEGAPPP